MNPILATDSYKVTHWKQYPAGTEKVYSYFESRGGDFDQTIFFGLQHILKQHMRTPITQEDIDEAAELFAQHFGDAELFNRAGWELMLERHGGRFPVEIKAVAEGVEVPTSNVLMTIVNTDPDFFWLPNYLETLLVHVWYPSTVATNSRAIRRLILDYLEKTGTPESIDFKLHDFGYRGVSTYEQAGIGGLAHLLSFLGTDTLAALEFAKDFYVEPGAVGYSIPASEHSTMTSWGRPNEMDAVENMLDQFPAGLVAVVGDSYNIYELCRKLGSQRFRSKILERQGTVVVRPDSGFPPAVVLAVLNALEENFVCTKNAKGFKVLPDQLRVIQGDGIDRKMIGHILKAIVAEGWSADNIGFGSGGGLLQKFDRDTSKYAFKCSAIKINGEWNDDIQKDPITDPGKKSKSGHLSLVRVGGELVTLKGHHEPDLLQVVYRDGELLREFSLSDIRDLLGGA